MSNRPIVHCYNLSQSLSQTFLTQPITWRDNISCSHFLIMSFYWHLNIWHLTLVQGSLLGGGCSPFECYEDIDDGDYLYSGKVGNKFSIWCCLSLPDYSKGWGAIAKLLPLVDLFLLSTNEKALFFTVLSELSVAYFMDKNYLKPIFLSTAMDSWSCAGEDAVLL